jgi:AcrR family transcriptional regulator
VKENVTNSQSRRGQREREVFEAALDVFAELGFKKASIEDIARRLGMSPAALYRYATDKRDLYRKAVALGFSAWQEAVTAALAAETDPVQRFRTVCTSAFAYLGRDVRLRKVLARDPSLFPFFAADDPFSDINRSSVDLLEGVIRDGVTAGAFAARGGEADIRAAAEVIFSLYVLFVQKAYVAGEEESLLFQRGLDLVLDGLRAR